MKELTQAEKKRWMRQWKSAALALQQVKRRELAAMTDDDVRKAQYLGKSVSTRKECAWRT